jgi:NAD(P)-dependent dehydrogenase (short-subunit alcohol dehydrogenase family)
MPHRIVLVTGGAKGVGRGISARFLAAGDEVLVCSREAPGDLLEHADRHARFLPLDVRDTAAVEALFALIDRDYGRIDVLVNNAGGAPYALAAKASPRFHESIFRLNLLAPLQLAQQANARMQNQDRGGVIQFIGSVSALRPSPGTAAYGAAKAAVLSLTQSLAVEWAPKVRVVCISPGAVRTEQAHLHYGDEAGIARVEATVPMQRMASPEDIGEACLWLASPAAAYVSGSNLTIHGGGERPAFLDAATANKR